MSKHLMTAEQLTKPGFNWAAVQPGDRVVLPDGDFDLKGGAVTPNAMGDPGNPVVIDGYGCTLRNGCYAIVQGYTDWGGWTWPDQSYKAPKGYIRTEGLTVRNPTFPPQGQPGKSAAWFGSSDPSKPMRGIEFYDCIFSDQRFGLGAGMNLQDVRSDGIRQWGSASELVIDLCEIYGFSTNAIALFGLRNSIIRRCTSWGIGGTGPIHAEHIACFGSQFNAIDGLLIEECRFDHDDTPTTGNWAAKIHPKMGAITFRNNAFTGFRATTPGTGGYAIGADNKDPDGPDSTGEPTGPIILEGNTYINCGQNYWIGDSAKYLIDRDNEEPTPVEPPPVIPPDVPDVPPDASPQEFAPRPGDTIRFEGGTVLEVK